MPRRQPKPPGRIRSSIVLRLNLRLFLRLLGVHIGTGLLLLCLALGGLLLWSHRQCLDVAELVEQRGIPSPEASLWMSAGNYAITTLDAPPEGDGLWIFGRLIRFNALGLDLFGAGEQTLSLGEGPFFLGPWTGQVGRGASYSLALDNQGAPYAITLNLEGPVRLLAYAGRILLLCQLFSLLWNLFRNAGLIKKTLQPIQELAAAAARLGNASAPSGMSPKELSALAGRLDQITASHLDTRIPVSGTQKELRTLAEAINAMLDRLAAAYRAQMRFVSDASHELRTPISVIQGYASLLDRWGKDDPETRQEAIDAIRSEAGAMKELVEQLLFLVRGDNDSMHIEMTDFDLTEVAAQVLKETEMIDQTHPFAARWAGGPVPVHADLGLMKQCLRVLVDNSVKYTPAGGRITIRVEPQGDTARLSVQDEGQGIDPKSLPHIFERFFRTDQSRTRQTGGTGLGLAIAKYIVDRHGGWLEVLSREGVGTRMTVVLPLARLEERV